MMGTKLEIGEIFGLSKGCLYAFGAFLIMYFLYLIGIGYSLNILFWNFIRILYFAMFSILYSYLIKNNNWMGVALLTSFFLAVYYVEMAEYHGFEIKLFGGI